MNFMIDDRFTLDTNILFYSMDREAGIKRDIAKLSDFTIHF